MKVFFFRFCPKADKTYFFRDGKNRKKPGGKNRFGKKLPTLKVTTVRSKVLSRSHYDIAHLQLPTNVPTMSNQGQAVACPINQIILKY